MTIVTDEMIGRQIRLTGSFWRTTDIPTGIFTVTGIEPPGPSDSLPETALAFESGGYTWYAFLDGEGATVHGMGAELIEDAA